jgi:hypothetical protein
MSDGANPNKPIAKQNKYKILNIMLANQTYLKNIAIFF